MPGRVERELRASTLERRYEFLTLPSVQEAEFIGAVRLSALVVLHEAACGEVLVEVCERLRRHTHRPVLVIAAKADEVRQVAVLAAGADDCVPDEASPREIIARLRALLRRDREYARSLQEMPCCVGELSVDPGRHEVWVRGESVELAPKEFDLLVALAAESGRPVRRADLLERVWGYGNAITTRTLDVHIGRLRRKIEAEPSQPRLILTVPGVGYKLAALK